MEGCFGAAGVWARAAGEDLVSPKLDEVPHGEAGEEHCDPDVAGFSPGEDPSRYRGEGAQRDRGDRHVGSCTGIATAIVAPVRLDRCMARFQRTPRQTTVFAACEKSPPVSTSIVMLSSTRNSGSVEPFSLSPHRSPPPSRISARW